MQLNGRVHLYVYVRFFVKVSVRRYVSERQIDRQTEGEVLREREKKGMRGEERDRERDRGTA